ncbi:MAG: YidC/Oxa1 family membrane protein insertase [Anaerolineae bacterium]
MIGQLWTTIILEPMINLLVLLYSLLFNNFALAIVGLTILIRLITYPLLRQQLRSLKAMQELSPKLQALQKKYEKNREKLTEETMKLYREHGVNPAGGCLPMLIQMPVWIGLYQSIYQVLGETPEQLMNLSQHIYHSVPFLYEIARRAIPLNSRFLWLNLARPDPYYILPILVVAVFWLQQRMSTVPSADPQQASMNQTMSIMMPIMFGFFTLQVSSGLAIYWVVSGVLGIIQQYFVTGWGGLKAQPVASGKEDGRKKKRRGKR